jgi:tetratricopeptide (TPR) repeat protein
MIGLGRLKVAIERLFNGPPQSSVTESGHRSATVGGDAIGNVVATGDRNVYLTGADAVREALEAGKRSRTHQLPADLADFAGREAQVEALLGVLGAPGGRAAISAIDGMAGLGKTTLAVHVAHRLAERNSDGQLVLDMAGTSAAPLPPAQALARLIRAFEPLAQLPESVEELRSHYLSLLRGKRVLLILDNARDGDQVAPLLPPESCALIVTARRQIAVAGLRRVDLDLLGPDEAVGLLRSILGEYRATAAALCGIAELCGFLPLALRVAGMFLEASEDWSAAEYIAAFAEERERLGRLRLELSAELGVAASLALSVRDLRREQPDHADHWHELAVFPAGFDVAGAAGVWDQPVAAARDALGLLLGRSMVLYDPAQQRWRLHDLMRDLAGGNVAAALGAPANLAARLEAARRRHAQHYRGVLAGANDLYLRGGASILSGLALFDGERGNVEAGQAWANEHAEGDPAAARLCIAYPDVGAYVLALRQHPRQRIAWLETAVAVAGEIGDRQGESTARGNLGNAHAALGETRRAIELYKQCLVIAREIGDRRGEGYALNNLGLAHATLGEPRRAIELYEQQLVIEREIGDRRGEGNALGNLGLAHAALGEPRRAIGHHEQALAISRAIGDRRAEGQDLGNLALAHAALGETHRAIELYEQRLVIARQIGDRKTEVYALGNLGLAHADLGEPRRAIGLYEQCLVIAREIGDRHSEGASLGYLGNAHAALGAPRRAIEHLEQALAISRAIGDRRAEGQDLSNLGLAHAALGETHRAIEHHDECLAIAREIGNRRGEGAALGNLGFAHAALGEPRRAIELLHEALEIFVAIEDPNATKLRAVIARLKKGGGS